MEYGKFGKELVEAAQNEAKHAAIKLTKSLRLSKEDREDLEQNLILAVLEKADSYDESRASVRTFVGTIINGAVLHEVRGRKRASNRELVNSSLNYDVFDGEETVPAHETMDRVTHLERLGRSIKDPFEMSDVKTDLSEVISQLSPEQQSLVGALSETTTRSAARMVGISRRAVYQHIGEIRNIMSDSGLHVYVQKKRDTNSLGGI